MADALASGASVRKDVGVQVPPSAPGKSTDFERIQYFFFFEIPLWLSDDKPAAESIAPGRGAAALRCKPQKALRSERFFCVLFFQSPIGSWISAATRKRWRCPSSCVVCASAKCTCLPPPTSIAPPDSLPCAPPVYPHSLPCFSA